MFVDECTGKLFLRLLSLTNLDVRYNRAAPVDFLPQLPRLTALNLACANGEASYVSADSLLSSLVLCSGLTKLDLTCRLNPERWNALFVKLAIKKLTIDGGLFETLQCFAAGSHHAVAGGDGPS